MKKIISATILVLMISISMLAFNIQAAESSEPPATEWAKTYGGAGSDSAYSLVQTSDGGYALAGRTSSFGAGGWDFWLVKTDFAGNMQWNQTYGGTSDDVAHDLVQTGDGGYAIAGYTYSFGAGKGDFWVVKTDSLGNHLWNKTYGGTESEAAQSIIETEDGYAITGSTVSYGAGSGDFWLVKTDSLGNHLWNKTYGGTGNEGSPHAIQTGDRGYAILGFTESYGAGWRDFWLVKTNSTGDMEWAVPYGGGGEEYARTVIETSDGGYALTGLTSSFGAGSGDFWLVKTDSLGNMQWNQTYGGTNYDQAFSVVEASEGGYTMVGWVSSFGAGDADFWLVKTDSDGNMQWNQTYGGTRYDEGRSLVQTSDGGYALAGFTGSFGAGSDDFWLVKLAPEGPPAPPDFEISVVPPLPIFPFILVSQGRSVSCQVIVKSLFGFASPVSLELEAPPDLSIAWSFCPSSIVPDGTSILTLTTWLSTALGSYEMRVIGTSDGMTRDSIFHLIVLPAPELRAFEELKEIYDVYYGQALYSDWWNEMGDLSAEAAGEQIHSALMSPSKDLLTRLLPEILGSYVRSVNTASSAYGAVKTLIHIYTSIQCYAVRDILAMPLGGEQYRYAEMRSSLENLVTNTNEVIDAFRSDPSAILTSLDQRKGLIEDLYQKLQGLNGACYNYYNMAELPFIRKAYEIVRAHISSLRGILKSDYEYTTYLIDGQPSSLSESIDAPLGQQEFRLEEDYKIDLVNTFETFGEEKVYRVHLLGSEIDKKKLIVTLTDAKDVDFELYSKFGSQPTRDSYDEKAPSDNTSKLRIDVKDLKVGDYYILVACPEGFGDYELEVRLK